MPLLRLACCIALGLVAASAEAQTTAVPPPPPGPSARDILEPPASVPASPIAGHFRMTTTDGTPVDTDALAGRPYGLFFGFTHCPDVCPTTLVELSMAMERLPPAAKDLRIYFVSVDPERDTAAVLAGYMTSFDPRLVALTGDRPAVDEAIRSFGVVARRTDLGNGSYTYGHTASVFLVDGDGIIVNRIGFGKGPDQMARALAALVEPAPAARPPARAP